MIIVLPIPPTKCRAHVAAKNTQGLTVSGNIEEGQFHPVLRIGDGS